MFTAAKRQQLKARIALVGPQKSGKSFTALRWAMVLAADDKSRGGSGRVALIESESRSARKYVGYTPDGIPFEFDTCELSDYSPESYTQAILYAGQQGYSVLVLDSLTHAWSGPGGALTLVDQLAEKSRSKNKFTDGWKYVTPMHQAMISSFLASPCHIIATMRSKMKYALEKNDKGVHEPKKLGIGPIQRNDIGYEFDIIGDLNSDHVLHIPSSRCAAVEGMYAVKPGAAEVKPIIDWLNEGEVPPAGTYTANEADIIKIAKARIGATKAAADKPAGGKRKTAKQLIEEAAAAAALAAGGQTVDTATHASSTSTVQQPAVQAGPAAAVTPQPPEPAKPAAPVVATTAAPPVQPIKTTLPIDAIPQGGSTAHSEVMSDIIDEPRKKRITDLAIKIKDWQPDIVSRISAKVVQLGHSEGKIKDLTKAEADAVAAKLESMLTSHDLELRVSQGG